MKLRVVTKVLSSPILMYGLDQLCRICWTLSTFTAGKLTVYVKSSDKKLRKIIFFLLYYFLIIMFVLL